MLAPFPPPGPQPHLQQDGSLFSWLHRNGAEVIAVLLAGALVTLSAQLLSSFPHRFARIELIVYPALGVAALAALGRTAGHLLYAAWRWTPFLQRSNGILLIWVLFPLLMAMALAYPDLVMTWLPRGRPGDEHLRLLSVVLGVSLTVLQAVLALRGRLETNPMTTQAPTPPDPQTGIAHGPATSETTHMFVFVTCFAIGAWATLGDATAFPPIKGLLTAFGTSKAWNDTWVPTALSALAVAAYGFFGYYYARNIRSEDARKLAVKRLTNEAYYMGFLLTLVGIMAALQEFPDAKENAAKVIGKCGSAVSSTIVAIVLKVLFARAVNRGGRSGPLQPAGTAADA